MASSTRASKGVSSSSSQSDADPVRSTKRNGRTVFVETWGCQMNVYDSGRMADVLAPEGYIETATMEDADLVVPARLHLVGEVAGGDFPRPLRELFDRPRDPAREVEGEPREREHDDQGHQEEEQDVDALDGTLQELQLLVLLERLGDASNLGLELLGDVDRDDGRRDRAPERDGGDEGAAVAAHLLVLARAAKPRARHLERAERERRRRAARRRR